MIYDLGIDVGTSYTAAAVRRPDGVVEVVGLGPIADNIPTVLYLGDDGTLIVGDAANRRSVIDPAGAAREFKRRMGDPTPMILRSSPFSAEALMARMIDYVTQRVADRERDLPRHTVVTHPANWGPYKLELFDQALRLAGAGVGDRAHRTAGRRHRLRQRGARPHRLRRRRLRPRRRHLRRRGAAQDGARRWSR